MDQAVAAELRLHHAMVVVETATSTSAERRLKAEQLQRTLWTHREAIHQLVVERPLIEAEIRDLAKAIGPFARCATLLPDGHNPVLFSLPSPVDGGRTFIQLRPEHFRRAAELLRIHAS